MREIALAALLAVCLVPGVSAQEAAGEPTGPLSPAEVLPVLRLSDLNCQGGHDQAGWASEMEFNERCTPMSGAEQQQCYRHTLSNRLREVLGSFIAPQYLVGKEWSEEPKDARAAIRLLKKERAARDEAAAAVIARGKQVSGERCEEGLRLVIRDCTSFVRFGYELPSKCYSDRLAIWLGGGGLEKGDISNEHDRSAAADRARSSEAAEKTRAAAAAAEKKDSPK